MNEIHIKGDLASVTTQEGKTFSMSLEKLWQLMAPRTMDSDDVLLPDGARFLYSRGPITVFVYERRPGIYPLRWIKEDSPARYGEGATYRNVALSLPYVVVLAAFHGGTLSDFNECFFRVEPLSDTQAKNELLYPGLLNCSRFKPPDGKPLSWICTQKLDRSRVRREPDPAKRIRAGLAALLECLFETGFNYSSEAHEYSSWYSESRKVDRRISSIQRWHEASGENPLFALDVPWLKTGMTLSQVVDRIFSNQGAVRSVVRTSRDLARIIINHSK